MSKKKKKARNHRKNELTKGIFTVLEKEPKKSFTYKQIASRIGVTDAHERNELIKKLSQLKESKRVLEETRGHYKAVTPTKKYHTGTVDITGRGNAYIVIEGMDDDVFVPFNKLRKAFHKDTVEVYIFPRRNGKKLEGEITKVIERKKSSFVGIVDMQKHLHLFGPQILECIPIFLFPKKKWEKLPMVIR